MESRRPQKKYRRCGSGHRQFKCAERFTGLSSDVLQVVLKFLSFSSICRAQRTCRIFLNDSLSYLARCEVVDVPTPQFTTVRRICKSVKRVKTDILDDYDDFLEMLEERKSSLTHLSVRFKSGGTTPKILPALQNMNLPNLKHLSLSYTFRGNISRAPLDNLESLMLSYGCCDIEKLHKRSPGLKGFCQLSLPTNTPTHPLVQRFSKSLANIGLFQHLERLYVLLQNELVVKGLANATFPVTLTNLRLENRISGDFNDVVSGGLRRIAEKCDSITYLDIRSFGVDTAMQFFENARNLDTVRVDFEVGSDWCCDLDVFFGLDLVRLGCSKDFLVSISCGAVWFKFEKLSELKVYERNKVSVIYRRPQICM